MKQVLWIGAILLLCISVPVFSDEIVTRANGQKILLKDDNTWEAVVETVSAMPLVSVIL